MLNKRKGVGMPRIKYCNKHNCHNIVKANESYCLDHKPKFDKSKVITNSIQRERVARDAYKNYNASKRDPELETFYHSKSWQQVRQYINVRDMNMCQVCNNAVTDRKIVDHIHPAKLSPSERLERANLWTLCYACHNHKTRLEESIKLKPNGDNILKHATKEWWIIAINNQRKKNKKQNKAI